MKEIKKSAKKVVKKPVLKKKVVIKKATVVQQKKAVEVQEQAKVKKVKVEVVTPKSQFDPWKDNI